MSIVFDIVIEGMESNEKLSPIVTELYLRGRKLNISIVFVSQSYFKVPKTIRHYFIISLHDFIMKIPTKKKKKKRASNHLLAIDFKDFMRLNKDYTKEAFPF